MIVSPSGSLYDGIWYVMTLFSLTEGGFAGNIDENEGGLLDPINVIVVVLVKVLEDTVPVSYI